MFAEKDHMTSVSENIMLGQLAPLGTGSFGLLLDDEKLKDAIAVDLGAELDPFTWTQMTPGRTPSQTTPSRMSPSGTTRLLISPPNLTSESQHNISIAQDLPFTKKGCLQFWGPGCQCTFIGIKKFKPCPCIPTTKASNFGINCF